MQEQLGFPRAPARRGTIRSLIRRFAAVALLPALAIGLSPAAPVAALPSTAAAPAEPGPALWVVQDGDTTIFLFGTFHALDGRANWFSRSVRAAFDASDELILETLVPEDPAELHAVLARNSLAGEPRVGQPVVSTGRASVFRRLRRRGHVAPAAPWA